ncbi:hypothetical protein TNCV_3498661 [Trichonephila clavipes]|nr:hypothetical protein TNCV_3498661 [Trichonephila clavipes]
MNVCKCLVTLRHGGALNSHPATNPLVRLVEGEEKQEDPHHLQRAFPQNWSGTEPNSTCMVLKATNNDRDTLQ